MAKEIDEIKKAAGDYQKWALAARKQYINLRLRQDKEIANLYIRSADRIAKELQQIGTTTISGQIQKKHLKELEKSLRAEAELIQNGLTEAFVDYIDSAAKAGVGYTQGVVLNLFDQAGLKTSGIRKLFSRGNKQAVEAVWARTRNGLYLSDRIWEQGKKYRTTMRDLIQESVAIGQDAVKTARMLQQYVRQGAMTLARDYPEMMKRMKGRIPGNISYEALRLARTEMTAAFGEGAIAAARVAPSYLGMKWVLSKSHPVPDICDTLSTYDSGLGPGVYPPGDEPPYPAHPNCLCALVPVHEEPEKFVEKLKRWAENPESEPELEQWYNNIYQEKAAEKQNRLTQSIKELEILDLLEESDYTDEVEELYYQMMKDTAEDGRERAVIWDKRDNSFSNMTLGEPGSGSTTIPNHLDISSAGANLTLIHTHPGLETLSLGDIRTLARYDGLEKMIAILPDGSIHSIEKLVAGRELERRADELFLKLKSSLLDDFVDGKITREQYFEKLISGMETEVLNKLHNEGLLKFEKLSLRSIKELKIGLEARKTTLSFPSVPKKTLERAMYDPDYLSQQLNASHGDIVLQDMAEEVGFHRKPTLLSKEEMDAYIQQGNRELLRGIAGREGKAEAYVEQFKTGEYFAGKGVYGNGIYTAYGEDGMEVAKQFADGVEKNVLRMALKKDAKIISYDALIEMQKSEFTALQEEERALRRKARREADRIYDETGDDDKVEEFLKEAAKKWEEMEKFRRVLADSGRYALYKGYDAIDIPSSRFMVVLNRGKVFVQK